MELNPALWQVHGLILNDSMNISSNLSSPAITLITYQPIYSPHCPGLLQGNPEEIALIKEMLFKEVYKETGPEYYVAATKNCDQFKRAYRPQSQPTLLEQDFPIAYIIVVHKIVEQVERLLRAVYRPWNVYCFHIDQKAPYIFHQAIQGIISCFNNVFIASNLEWVVYGGSSRLQADINCMQDLLKANSSWKYVVNLSGQEFPLKTNLELVQHLSNLNGLNDISSVADETEHILDRYTFVHKHVLVNKEDKVEKTSQVKPPPPGNITIYHGTSYNVFAHAFVDYVIHNEFAQTLLAWFVDTYSPDEHYWASLQALQSTPGHNPFNGWSATIRAIKWTIFENIIYPPCNGKLVRQVCVYGVGDLQWLTQQRHIFANKFDISVDHVVYHCLDNYISNKTFNEIT